MEQQLKLIGYGSRTETETIIANGNWNNTNMYTYVHSTLCTYSVV